MRHAVTYTSAASGRTRRSVVGVTNGSAVVSLTIRPEGQPNGETISAPLTAEQAVTIAAANYAEQLAEVRA